MSVFLSKLCFVKYLSNFLKNFCHPANSDLFKRIKTFHSESIATQANLFQLRLLIFFTPKLCFFTLAML